jgi:DNA gyrase/topoisomerase IV subunit A
MKIKKIKAIHLEKEVPVYDISVKKHHNFILTDSKIVAHNCDYVHGDGPATSAISKMAQDFVGSNNIPFFGKKGNFGNRFIKEPSAPRYIYVKDNPFYKKIFIDKMLEKYNLDDPEPKYFLPTIPTILLNGVAGVAVGFATKILPYKLEDIKQYISSYIDGGTLPELKPYYKGYAGKIEFDENDKKWVMHGVYEVINTTTIKITELPICMDREKYLKILSGMIERDQIVSFKDESSDGWNIIIRLKRKSPVLKNPEKYLRLTQILSENITTIDENGKLKIFEDVYSLIDYFIKFRMGIYTQRIKWMINSLNIQNELISEKIKFIKKMCSINFKKMKYAEIVECMTQINIKKDIIKQCMDIRAHNLNVTYIEKLKEKILENKKDIKFYKNTSEKELYHIDLAEI